MPLTFWSSSLSSSITKDYITTTVQDDNQHSTWPPSITFDTTRQSKKTVIYGRSDVHKCFVLSYSHNFTMVVVFPPAAWRFNS